MDSKQNLLESAYFRKCEHQIRTYFKSQVKKEVMKDFVPIVRQYIDRWGFIQTDVREPDINIAERQINERVHAVLKEPYFCHVDYAGNSELYLGKQAVHGWITDWADERASFYYQYEMYIGNKNVGLNFVRDIILKNSKYDSYSDKYNAEDKFSNLEKVTDKHLAQIIAANQNNKKIHDIVESIQKNQYEIITSDKDKSMLLLGCAGSGKTMILMHKIRYMKYNNSELKMSDIIIISPTDILGRESKELSKLLQVENTQQFTTASFYENICKELFGKLGFSYEDFHILDEDFVEIKFYDSAYLDYIATKIYNELNDSKYLNNQQEIINQMLNEHIGLSNQSKKIITEMHNLYIDSVKEIQKAGRKDIERIIRNIEQIVDDQENIEDTIEILKILQEQKVFTGTKDHLQQNFAGLFLQTNKIIKLLDVSEFLRTAMLKSFVTESTFQMIQILHLFMQNEMEWEGVQKILQEWESISEKDVNEYIKYLEGKLDEYDHLNRKREILQILLDNEMVMNRVLENKKIQYQTSFEKLVKLYDKMEETLDDIGYDPFSYFEQYEKIDRKRRRLQEQKKAARKNDYLFDAILDTLNIKYTKDSDIFITGSQSFVMTYILYQYVGVVTYDKKYIFIDEFQDFSPSELNLIYELYPNAVINLFGDVQQCINIKGINLFQNIPEKLFKARYMIKENYRNARQITDYIQNNLGIKMLPVGLDGIVKEFSKFPEIIIESDDRVAVIVSNIEKFKEQNIVIQKQNYYSESREIVRGVYNIIPVSMTKGLEFEKVIVIREGLSSNEFYVACTRAISELYIVLNDDNKKEYIAENEELANNIETGIEEDVCDNIEDSDRIPDFSEYTLVPFKGKLKTFLERKNIQNAYILLCKKGKEKNVPISYVEETKCAYITKENYKKYKTELLEHFSNGQNIRQNKVENNFEQVHEAFIDDMDFKGTVKIIPF